MDEVKGARIEGYFLPRDISFCVLQKGSQCGDHGKGVDREEAGGLPDSSVYTAQGPRAILRTHMGNKYGKREEKPAITVLPVITALGRRTLVDP